MTQHSPKVRLTKVIKGIFQKEVKVPNPRINNTSTMNLAMKTVYGIFLLAMFSLNACGSSGGQAAETEGAESSNAGTAQSYTLTPFSPSQAYPDASIESVEFQNGTFTYEIANYELGIQTPDAGSKMCANSGQGQHIHLIIDNEPYSAQYTPTFNYEISDGEHHMLSFLSRSYHESVKNPDAKVAWVIQVENNSITEKKEITEPMLFYSRPKGTYVGEDTEKVMLDFYVLNAGLDSNYKVEADINGETYMIDTWQPYYIEGLPMGENTIKLTLVDGNGNAVDAPLNPVSRAFTLTPDPAEAQ